MFSKRTAWNLAANRLAAALGDRRRSGKEILDLTISNPARAGIPYPADAIAAALANPRAHEYDPAPRGDRLAREAIAGSYAGRGIAVEPDQIVLTASTSEAYSWLFKLLSDPGDRVLVPRPSYPLFEFLATLESVTVGSYPLRYDDRWEIDREAFPTALEDSPRAIVLVNPNNPTGSYVSRSDLEFLASLAGEREIPLISDEVFSAYPLDAGTCGSAPSSAGRQAGTQSAPDSSSAGRHSGTPSAPDSSSAGCADAGPPGSSDLGPQAENPCPHTGLSPGGDLVHTLLGSETIPAFVLDGLSKSAGLAGMKVGWIVVLGPRPFHEEALARLEMIADTYLSTGTHVQRALPRLIELGGTIASSIRARTEANLAALREGVHASPAAELLRAEGGWSAILRVPATRSEEAWCLELLTQDGVLVQPGWFFDFDHEAFLVLSLLTPPATFREGVAHILRRV